MKIRACIPYPFHGAISPKTSAAVEALQKCPDWEFELLTIQGVSVRAARNTGISGGECHKKWQKPDGFDYFLSIDADTAPTVAAIKKLIARDKDVVSAAYLKRDCPDQFACGDFIDNAITADSFILSYQVGMRKVGFVAAGCLLIKSSVFERMPYPWFNEPNVEAEIDGVQFVFPYHEDIGFSLNAAAAEVELWCDCDTLVEHDYTFKPQAVDGPKKQNPATINAIELQLLKDLKEMGDSVGLLCHALRSGETIIQK